MHPRRGFQLDVLVALLLGVVGRKEGDRITLREKNTKRGVNRSVRENYTPKIKGASEKVYSIYGGGEPVKSRGQAKIEEKKGVVLQGIRAFKK